MAAPLLPSGRRGLRCCRLGMRMGTTGCFRTAGMCWCAADKAPIAGRVSMDQTVVDVTEIPGVAIGDEVVLLGSQGRHSITAWDLADLAETIPWEVLCAISPRVPRRIVA